MIPRIALSSLAALSWLSCLCSSPGVRAAALPQGAGVAEAGCSVLLADQPVARIGPAGGAAGLELRGRSENVRFPAPGVADLTHDRATITFPPHAGFGVTDAGSFTIELDLRARHGSGFGTILMCRQGSAVHYSLVIGRRPGHVSFELWSWSVERAGSDRRLDDGQWHRLAAAYDASTRNMALCVDGELHAVVPVERPFGGSAEPALRLGNNLDPSVHQPFDGSLREVSIRPGVPPLLAEHLALRRATTLQPAEAVDAALERWLEYQRRRRPPAAQSTADWTARARHLHAGVQDALGLWPPPYSGERLSGRRSPLMGASAADATDFASVRPTLDLDVREGGTLQRDGFRLTRLYWQTFDGFSASGYLYRPDGEAVERSRPAVLCPHGHWADGARHPVVQSRCIMLARLGYVVLAVDSIHLYDDRIGLSPLSVMIWNNLRGLEVLRGLPEVDGARIGSTGASGGGQQTYYLTALRAGLAAAVPAVMACHFAEILGSDGVHCACNHVPHLVRAADMPEMAAAFAPKPQLFLSVTGDWTKNFPEQGFPEIGRIYQLFGAAGSVGGQQWQKGHDYDRPMRNAMYAFFERHLHGRQDPALELEQDGAVEAETAATLRALDRADVPRAVAAIRAEFATRLGCPPVEAAQLTGEDRARQLADLRRRFADLLRLGEDRLPAPAGRAEPARFAKPFSWRGQEHEAWLVRAEPEIELPVLRLRPEASAREGRPAAEVAILVSSGGKADVLRRRADWIDALLERGTEVVVADLRYTGELDRGAAWRDLYGRFFGWDEGVLAARDLRSVLDALPRIRLGRDGAAGGPGASPPASVLVVAFGAHGAPALLAAAVDDRIGALCVPDLGPQYRAAERRPLTSRILLHGDLADAACLCAPRPLLAGGVPDPSVYGAARAAYSSAAGPEPGERLVLTERALGADALDAGPLTRRSRGR